MTEAEGGAEPPAGLCHRCDEPIRAGDEERVPMDHATSAGGDILLHRAGCRPVVTRTYSV